MIRWDGKRGEGCGHRFHYWVLVNCDGISDMNLRISCPFLRMFKTRWRSDGENVDSHRSDYQYRFLESFQSILITP